MKAQATKKSVEICTGMCGPPKTLFNQEKQDKDGSTRSLRYNGKACGYISYMILAKTQTFISCVTFRVEDQGRVPVN